MASTSIRVLRRRPVTEWTPPVTGVRYGRVWPCTRWTGGGGGKEVVDHPNGVCDDPDGDRVRGESGDEGRSAREDVDEDLRTSRSTL